MAIRLKNHTKGLELWRGLSRYDSDLLLGLTPCAYFLRYRLYGSRRSSPLGFVRTKGLAPPVAPRATCLRWVAMCYVAM